MRKIIVLVMLMAISCKKTGTKPPIAPVQKVMAVDTLSHQAPREIKYDTIKHLSKPFEENKILMYWEKNYVMANDALSETFVRLLNYKTKKLLIEATLDFEDHIDNSDAFYAKLKEQSFEDFNFDGFVDVSAYSRGSTAMTSVTGIYLFNPKTKTFDFSEELSATGVEVDKKARMLTATNYDLNSETATKHHFDKLGRIKYTEVIVKNFDSLAYTTYEKIVKGKVVERKVDSVASE